MLFFNIKKRIAIMSEALQRIAAGDLEQRIHIYSRDEIGRLAGAINDMTAALQNEITKLRQENNQAKAILNSMVEGVIAVDKETRIVSVNPTIEKIFTIAKRQAEGRFFLEVIRNNDIAEVINTVLEKGEFVSKELSLVWPVRKILQVNVSPIFDGSIPLSINPLADRKPEKNTVSGCVVVIHDITEIRTLETMRRDFVANVSHELKTPLTSIKGFVETLLAGAIDDKENNRHFLEVIRDHSNRLDTLINDLLALSYIESKEARLEPVEISLKGLTDEILSGFTTQVKEKNLKIHNEIAGTVLIRADKDKIEQVFVNLIGNAIKFNKENGFIKIYSQDSDGCIKIIVEDSGIGIPEKDISRIFERFYRVDKARSRQLGGTGLGLSIVKHIVELHGGLVGVDSTEGIGSKFWFTLPK
jgi:two-component system phosphate regulon sensor histidine kinase PhoR